MKVPENSRVSLMVYSTEIFEIQYMNVAEDKHVVLQGWIGFCYVLLCALIFYSETFTNKAPRLRVGSPLAALGFGYGENCTLRS